MRILWFLIPLLLMGGVVWAQEDCEKRTRAIDDYQQCRIANALELIAERMKS